LGREANECGNFDHAESIFDACYKQFGIAEARISAANMRFKQGRVREALSD